MRPHESDVELAGVQAWFLGNAYAAIRKRPKRCPSRLWTQPAY